jgi:signal transduction histidine kinase
VSGAAPLGRAAEAALLFVLYAAAASGSIALAAQPGSVAGLWFANAVAMGFLATAERARWAGLLGAMLAANLVANLANGHSLTTALGFLPGNVVETLVGAYALTRAGVGRDGLRSPRAMLYLIGLGAIAAPLVGATVGAATLQAFGAGPFWPLWQRWLEGAVIGAISLLALVICWRRDRAALVQRELLDARVLVLALLASGVVLLSLAHLPFPFIYTALPMLLAAIVLEMTGALAVVLVASLVIAASIATGIFVTPPIVEQWEELFVYAAYAAALLPAQLLAATMADLRDSHARLAVASAELERANQGLEQFVHIASHDLREPLNTVVQFTGLVKSDHGDQLPESARQWLTLVERAGVRMRTLLDDVLHYVRVQRSAGDPGRAVPLDAVLQEVLQSLAARIRDSGAVVAADELPVVRGHASLLALALQNLLSNALKFVPPGRQPVVRITSGVDGEVAVITVSDNGIGVAAEDLPRLFQPFQRLHLRRHYEGSGLGLALVKQIAVAHGGSVGMVSQPGVGTAVTLRLPLEAAAAKAQPLPTRY